VDINEIIKSIEKMLQCLIGEKINLLTLLSTDIGKVKVDPVQLQQVLLNLAVNAHDAMPEGGQLTIITENYILNDVDLPLHPQWKPGRYAVLSATDTGTGMTPEVKARIFEPFYTTKEIGKGTGIGLATVFGIVTQSEGHIEVISEVGAGSCFKIFLPVSTGMMNEIPVTDLDLATNGDETIILVEDEVDVRKVAKLSLEVKGYTVWEAQNGEQALTLTKMIKGSVHLLLTDLVMPGMDGRRLKEEMEFIYPKIKILYISGYIDDSIVQSGIAAQNVAFLSKPFTPAALAKTVREVLDDK
jgi:CheY-like chemotaxis protein